jgi:hypothetical protein
VAGPSDVKKQAKISRATRAKDNPDDYEVKELRFQRMVMTDGYSLSALLTTAGDARGQVLGSRALRTDLPRIDADTYTLFREYLDDARFNRAGADPGKKDLVHMTDGERSFRQTRARHERECGHLRHQARIEEMKRRAKVNGVIYEADAALAAASGAADAVSDSEDDAASESSESSGPIDGETVSVHHVETRVLSMFSSKTCISSRYEEYLLARQDVSARLRQFYEMAYFRTSKYTVYLRTKASRDRMVDRIRNIFGGRGPDEHRRAIVVFWGDWGMRPNALRNGPSSPGIGLRRFVHARLKRDRFQGTEYHGMTITTGERKTSSVCNACGGGVHHGVDSSGKETHRLLQCVNPACGVLWARDALGSCNIRMEGNHRLHTGRRHPWLAV